MLDKDDDDDRSSPQKCWEILCEPAFKKGRRALTSLLSKQHVLRAALHSTDGTKATTSLRRTKHWRRVVPGLGMASVHLCSEQVLHLFTSFFSFLSSPSFTIFLYVVAVTCKSKLTASKNLSFNAGRLFIVGPVPNKLLGLGFLGTNSLELQITLSSEKVTFLLLWNQPCSRFCEHENAEFSCSGGV